jgi:hypothetical protein
MTIMIYCVQAGVPGIAATWRWSCVGTDLAHARSRVLARRGGKVFLTGHTGFKGSCRRADPRSLTITQVERYEALVEN